MVMISPFFQLIPLFLSIAAIITALYWRLNNYQSQDTKPAITPITPSSLKKFGGSPSIIKVGLYITQFQKFDMVENDFIFNGVIWFEFHPGTISLDTLKKFTIEKGTVLKKSEASTQIIDDKLLVKYNVSIKFTSTLNYQEFPFDSHELFIYVSHPTLTPSEITFESSLKDLQISPEASTHGWQLIDKNATAGYQTAELDRYHEERTIHYPAVIFALNYRRYGIRFIILITLPIMFMFYVAMFSFSIASESPSISISVASITAILAYRFVIEQLSPETGYFLVSDYLFLLFLFGVFIVFIFNILENFVVVGFSLLEKKITLLSLYFTITMTALYILIFKGRKNIYILQQTFKSGKKWWFNSITDLEKFTKKMPEYPPMDNEDLQNPVYIHFYKGFLPNPVESLLFKLFGKKLETTPNNLVDLLHSITEARKQQGLGGHFVTRISLNKPARFFIWTDLHASIHSFQRSLTWLINNKDMHPDFTLISDNIYLVFNGDSIDRGAYNLETIYLILQLMHKNPKQVFYIRGLHEEGAYWQNYTLKQELSVRARTLSDEFIPLSSMFLAFFDTLPIALYIGIANQPEDVIRISNNPPVYLDEMQMGTFFTETSEPITHYTLTEQEEAPRRVNVKAIIKTEVDWLHKTQTREGLRMLRQSHGSTTWSLISGRIKILQKEYQFYYDAFACLQVHTPINESTLTLINRNIRTNEPFKQQETVNVITGRQSETTPMKSEIRIGSSMALVGGVSLMGQSTRDGVSTSVNETNKAGGIHGHYLSVIIYNDDYTPFLARQNVERLLNIDDTDLLLLPVGGPTLDSYIDYVREGKVSVLFPVTGAQQFRTPELNHLVNLRATSVDEVSALIDYVYSQYRVKKFAFFYQDDAYEPIDGAHHILKKRGITEWTDVPYLRGSTDFTEQIEHIKQAEPEAIGLFSTASAAQELFRQIGIDYLANKKLFGISFSSEKSIRLYAKHHGIDILFSSVVPNPRTSQLEIVQDYRKAMDASFYAYDNFSLEAYIGTQLLIQILEDIGSPPFSSKKILEHLEALNKFQFKGLTFTFNPQRRDLSPSVWLETAPDKEWPCISWDQLKHVEQDPNPAQ